MAECVLHDSGIQSVSSSIPAGQLTESDSDSTTQSLNSDNHAEVSDLPVFENKHSGNGYSRSISLETDNSSPQSDDVLRGRTCSDSSCADTESDASKRYPRRTGSILYRQGHPRVKKSVSFCSMPEDRRVANASDCLEVMQAGAELTKVKSNGRLYRRYYWLSENSQEITWAPTSKKANKARIAIDQIKEVRRGKKSECRDMEIAYQDEYILTILYGSNYSTLELVSRSPEEASVWIAGLSHLISKRIDTENGVPHGCDELGSGISRTIRDRWLMETFVERTGSRDSLLLESEVVKLLLRMNPAIDIQHATLKLKEIYSKLDRSTEKGFVSCDDFISVYKDVASRQEIYFLMTRYGCNDHMNAEDLMLFLETEQGLLDVSKKYCEDLILKYEPSREGKSKFLLGIDGLLAYSLSNDCDIFKSHTRQVHQDMTLPLSQYYINSSHKTYLLEDQLKGPSSVAAYARTLRLGCRYIEIDCWDGPTEPIVFHGRTLTSRILFTEVIATIQKYAFSTTQYPLIISLENHCSLNQQKIIVESIKTCLGEYLYTTPLNGNCSHLPSPQQLLNKIIIKGKKLKNDGDESSSYGEVSEEDESIDPDWKKLSSPKKEPIRRIKLLKELSDLVVWCRSSSYVQLLENKSSQLPWSVASVSDLYAVKLMQVTPEDFLNTCKNVLVRVYPNCARVDSSNFNPQDMWNCGCQIVTLNQQTQGVSFDLNVAMFKQNGDCGYVLKPQLLRDPYITFNPAVAVQSTLPGVNPQVLQIKVISGHRFPKPRGSATRTQITDPYVLLEIFGINSDCASARTKTVPGNGQNPFFDESFTFYINLPELAMIRFNILDDDYIGDEFIAQYTVSFNCLNTGYRHVNLLSSAGEKISGCTLFVHISHTNATDKKPIKKSVSGGVISSRYRVVKEPVQIRLVGIKALDDIAKCVLTQLQDLSQLRYNVEMALAKLKEMCDVSMVANIKLCVKTIVTRASMTPSLTLKLNSTPHPVFQVSGTVPDLLKKTVQAYNSWCRESITLIDSSKSIRKALVEMEQMMEQMQSEIDVVSDNKEKKTSKAQENFTWNRRVVKEQLTLLDEYVELCQKTFGKVTDAARLSNITVNES